MEQLKHSEEEILKLGKKLITELELVYTTDTLARWMAHYLSELLYNINECNSEKEKNNLQKECCKIILDIWNLRGKSPIDSPIEKLKPIIDILELLIKNNHPFIEHEFIIDLPEKEAEPGSWLDFLRIIKNNSERIYRLSLGSIIEKNSLERNKLWMENHNDFFNINEKKIIEYLDSFNNLTISFEGNSDKKSSEKEKLNDLFKKIEQNLDQQKKEFIKLKKTTLDKLQDV